jgi:phosphopantothenoylcysteine decarboxylase/phosphopantothenate--cysteine ligase
MARILLGVSGGIAAYKALEVVRLATAAGHAVRVVQTPASTHFVGTVSFAALTGAPVLVDEFEPDPARGAYPGDPVPLHEPISHLALVHHADVLLVAPASANTLAKLAAGLADSLLTSAALAASCPLLLAPAMNHHMWRHPATQENVRRLRERGATVIEPGEGRLASHGEHGEGRLAEPPQLLEALERALAGTAGRPTRWSGVRVLVTAGGTREPIDAVRYVGNRSSGRMGVALAAEARSRGAEVTLIGANLQVAAPAGVSVVSVATAAELQQACEERFPDCDVLFMSAAVADFRPADPASEKIKKAGRSSLELTLEATPDIISALAARRRPDQRIVGFAAESGELAEAYGRGKLEEKRLDAVVVNDISRPDIGFEVDANEVTILTAAGTTRLARADKRSIAAGVLDAVEPPARSTTL